MSDRAGNSTRIAQLVAQQCFGRAEDVAEFDAGLKATGWHFVRSQRANDANPADLDGWNLPTLLVLRGQPVKGTLSTCMIIVKDPISPSLGQMKAALSKAVDQKPGPDGEWLWKPDTAHRSHMMVENGTVENGPSGQSIFIHVETYRLPWWQSILG
ncbi:MAG TPA: hypothetical protein VK980_01005 [Sphingomonas sp.]|nr:hypothetical protein [Sphingomonas sp.]